MGIPGLLKEIGKGERVALSKLAVEFLEYHRRPIRIAIDIAIWQFQSQAGQGGQNPALRTFYYRLVRLLALPIHPLFVYDGPNKPLAKRGKVVSRYGTTNVHNELSKKLLNLFRYPYWTAPGEAEAECALLQRENIVDAVMSEDVDVVMWGSTMTLRDWSQEGVRGNKTPTHVSVLRADDTRVRTGLDREGMILVAMLSGGDYAPDGIPGIGPGLACEIAKAKFGNDLLEVVSKGEAAGLAEWRERLHYELESNESGYFKTRHRTVRLPEDFPDQSLLRYYTHPAVSTASEMRILQADLPVLWAGQIDVPALRHYVAQTFNWQYRGGAYKFIRSLAPALLVCRLLRGNGSEISSSNAISDRKMHFVNGGIPELRVTAIPAGIVGFNLAEEEDEEMPTTITSLESTGAADEDTDTAADLMEPDNDRNVMAFKTAQPMKKSPWNPHQPEKMWIPETIVKLGLPELVEEWEQKQREKASDPREFIASKARKTKASASATQQTRSINAYFATSKTAATAHRARDRASPQKKAPSDLQDSHTDRGIFRSTTPTRRKTRPYANSPISPLAAKVNPFSMASLSRSPVKSASTIHHPSVDDASIRPIRRKARPLRKSKTMPCNLEQDTNVITIASSPITSMSPIDNQFRIESTKAANSDPFCTAPSPSSLPPSTLPDLQDLISQTHRPPNKPKLNTTTSMESAFVNPPSNKPDLKSKVTIRPTRRPGLPLAEIFLPRKSDPLISTSTTTTNSTTSTGPSTTNISKIHTPLQPLPGTKTPPFPPSPPTDLPEEHQQQQKSSTNTTNSKQNPTTTSNPASRTRTITILPRSSLPGTWKEQDHSNDDDDDDDDDGNDDLDFDIGSPDLIASPPKKQRGGEAARKSGLSHHLDPLVSRGRQGDDQSGTDQPAYVLADPNAAAAATIAVGKRERGRERRMRMRNGDGDGIANRKGLPTRVVSVVDLVDLT